MKYNKTICTYFKLTLSLVFIAFSLNPIKAQTQQEQKYLLELGEKDSLYSDILKETRIIYIDFPADYNPNKQYPVAYILDGKNFLPTLSNVQSFYSGGFTPEMILVGISNSQNRTRDLTTSKITEMYGMPYNFESGEAENFLKFIKKELIPFIESKYPVTNYRSLIGHSYAGLFTIYSLLNQPDLFSNYIAIDPSLDWDNQKLLTEAQEKISGENYSGKSLFISLAGQLHMQNSNITIDNVMQDESDFTLFARSNIAFSDLVKRNEQNGLNFSWKFYPNDIHGTIAFPSIMDGMVSTFKWYQMENTDKINSFETSKEELFNIIKYREKKLQSHFGYLEAPYPEDLLNMSGYMNMDMNQIEKARMYFELAIKYYPESANAYDSMADFLEAQGDISNAIKSVQKAFEISRDDVYKERINKLQKIKN